MRKEYNPDYKEQQRIAIAIAIVGTVVALYALPIANTDFWSATRGFMLFPGFFAFLFLIMTGAHLKYKSPGTIGIFEVAHSLRQFVYNWMIDLFWIGFFVTVAFFAAALCGWDGKHMTGSYWLGLSIGGIFCFIIAVIGLTLWLKENKK